MYSVFVNDTAPTEIYTLSRHDALPISPRPRMSCSLTSVANHSLRAASSCGLTQRCGRGVGCPALGIPSDTAQGGGHDRSEEHTSELQSRQYLVCRLLLEKKQIQNASSH